MNTTKTFPLCVAAYLGLLLTVAPPPAKAADGEQLVVTRCAACHSIETPNDATSTLQAKMERKGPPLHYAGQKYRQDWLTGWLQKPRRITPSGGDFWANAVIVTDEGDEIDESRLVEHVALEADEALAVSDYLMGLEANSLLAPNLDYTPSNVTMLLARKDFRKFKGCSGCHRDEPDFGGVTGPELYTAMNRLQPAYIASYIADPIAWDRHTQMPKANLNEASILKLMNYLYQIKEPAQ